MSDSVDQSIEGVEYLELTEEEIERLKNLTTEEIVSFLKPLFITPYFAQEDVIRQIFTVEKIKELKGEFNCG